MSTSKPVVPLVRAARTAGIIGIVAALASWLLLGLLNRLWTYSSGSPGWIWNVVSTFSAVLTTGIPTIGGILVAFWIGVSLWSRSQSHPASGVPDENVLH